MARLMREMGLPARWDHKRAPRTIDSRHDLPVATDLLARNSAVEEPDLADASYIPTAEGWQYLAAIKDIGTREILGWSMADHLRAELCVDALIVAIRRHGPPPRGLIQYSDCGVQYASAPYRTVPEQYGIVRSTNRRENRLDRALMESFFAALKTKCVHHARFRSCAEAKAAVFKHVEIWCNRGYLHSGLGYCTPTKARASMEAIARRAAA